ncbi:MFS general substrate transporter [Hypoxylon sp. NC0597]|nr:MFS general substrate transporter [Hypoxylon sp. NC0597]
MAHTIIESSAKVSFSTEPKISGPSTVEAEARPGESDGPETFGVEANADAAEGDTIPKKPLGFYLSFFAINILVLLFSLDATTLAVAIPAIAAELHGTTFESFWAGIAYYLGLVVSQPLYASISDVFGRKPPLYVAFLLFTIGALTFSLARNMATIVVARVVQGLGAGGLDVLGEIIVSDMTTLKERPLYLGIMALPISIGSVLGPTIGALFSDFVTWRWIGWINLPFLGISCPLLVFFLRLRSLGSSFEVKMKRLDWGGMSLFAIGCTLFVLPLSWADSLYPWNSYQTILPLLLGAAILAGFVVYEAKPEAPVVPYRIFHSRTAAVTLCGGFFHGIILFTLLQYLPLFFQAVMLDSRIGSALTLLPTSFSSVLGAIASVIAIGKAGIGYKVRIWIAWSLAILGSGLLLLLDSSSPPGMGYAIPIIWGAGIGALLRLLHIPMQASVPSVDDTGHAIMLLLTFRCLGSLVGLAIGSTVFSSVFEQAIAAVEELPDSLSVLSDAHNAVAFIPTLRTLNLPADVIAPVTEAYLTSMRAVFYVVVGFSGLGLVTSLFTEELSLQRTDRGRQQFET